jgi:drug/metabolite transporter (DMT)-like permease
MSSATGLAALVSGATRHGTSALRSPLLALTLTPLFWSGNFIVGRALREDIDPVTLNFARWLIALVILAPFVWRDAAATLHVVRREWRLIVGLGATGIAAFQTLVYVALQSTTATNALFILSLTPIAILAGAVLIGTEQPGARQLAGALVSIFGAAILITRGDIATIVAAGFDIGDLWMLLGVAIFAAYSLLLRRRPADLPAGVALAASIAVALALLAPMMALNAGTEFAAFRSAPVVLGLVYVAVFSSVVAFLFWTYGVSQLGPTRSGQFIHLMPVFGAALAAGVLGEMPTLTQVTGGALVLLGILAVERRTDRPSAPRVREAVQVTGLEQPRRLS